MTNFKVGNTNFLGVDTSFVNMERSIEVPLSLRRVFWHMQENRKNDMRKTIKLMGRSKIFVDENFLHFFVRFLLPPKCQVLVSTLTVLFVQWGSIVDQVHLLCVHFS